ncbi:UPF0755 protein [Nakamurella sp. UYEF19]|uniref:endolytic transglycosylase MltG n=1 Tax=Nakamurella sp. UYEF19 TaxID=1756392 RepID=UPI003397A9BA
MSDQLGIFDRGRDDETGELNLNELRAALTQTASAAPPPPAKRTQARREQRAIRKAAAKRRKRRIRHTVIAVLVLGIIAGGVFVGFKVWRKDSTAIPNFTGDGTSETIVRVGSGDSLTDIADTLAADDVVASAQSFLDASAENADVRKIKTGYYKVRLQASAAAAVDAITDPRARVGQLRLIPGRQLADVTTKTGGGGAVTPGFITEITKAACVPLNGVNNCFTADRLWQVEETADPATLGVVSWAVPSVLKAPDPKKRLEGMLVPGDYDVPPGSTPAQALQSVIRQSTANWNSMDIVAAAKAIRKSPYEVAVVASLVQREAGIADMPKVARVAYNRLARNMKLEFDSTVNYSLDRAQISTTATERANTSPYNTYATEGLPPTPISSPGPNAIDAALNPADGNWLFFVKIDLDGNSCFSETLAAHNICVAQARKNGVFGR